MAKNVTVRLSGYSFGPKPFARVRRALADPLASGRGAKVAEVMRMGRGGIMEQRRRQAEMRGDNVIPWTPFQDYPKVRPPVRLLHRSGRSDADWMGRGQRSVTKLGKRSVAVGVTGVPGVHQRGATIKPRRFRNGIPLMRAAIAARTGRFISVKTLITRGIVIPPRPVAISRRMVQHALSTLLREIERQTRSGGAR